MLVRARITIKTIAASVILIPIAAFCAALAYISIINKDVTSPTTTPVIETQENSQSLQKQSPFEWKLNIQDVSIGDFSFSKHIASDESVGRKFSLEGKKILPKNKDLGLFQLGIVKELQIRDPKLTYYENNKPIATLTAEKATTDIPFGKKNVAILGGSLEFSGNVYLITDDKRILVSDKITWNDDEEKFHASGNCIASYEGKRLRADSINTDIKLTDFTYSNERNISKFAKLLLKQKG